MIRIREANVEDIGWILEQVSAFSKFYGAGFDLAGDKEHGYKYIHGLILNHFFRISELDTVRTGLIAGLIAPHHFNPKLKMLHELLWWVADEHRQTGSGKLLLEAYMSFGQNNGFDAITFTLEDNSPVPESILIKWGFRLKEKAYIKEAKQWQQ